MSQRRSPAVRRRAAVRQSFKTAAARQSGELPQLSDAPFLDEDGVDAGLGDEVGLDPPWQSANFPEKVVEALVPEESNRREPTAGVDDEGTPGTERLILLYLQEAGTVPLLTAADELRLAEHLLTAKAHLLEALRAALPAAAMPSELTPEAWLTEQLRQALAREPTAPGLAETLHLSVEQVRAMQTRTTPEVSLDTIIADGQGLLGHMIADRTFRNPLDTGIATELSDRVVSYLQALTPRDAYIVRARFGMDTGEGRTLEDIGKALQLSRERVRQLEAHALEKLRRASGHRRLHSFLEN
ncbi:MAG: sigma factor-like helix-turn-helix DNA-binding protein [Candidatus Entotheonellia bacterium]